ncbi:MAG: helix-turn-helix domain-containing protein [Synergistaceae bacterium]|jgi:transcriptional regulator with XRE-family HTH domain|nr:helix-turn-helix domain-containing protein [Synergistaceae bacterium]
MGVGKEIARVRKAKGWTQKYLAECVPIRPSFLSEIEAEKKTASFDTIVRLADALNCSLDELASSELADAAAASEVDRAMRYCKEDSLVRKSVIMMYSLDENEKYKIFTYIQDRMELSNMRSRLTSET